MNPKSISTNFYGTRSTRACAGLTLTESVYPPGFKMPRHMHEPAYFSLVLRGAYTENSGKSARACKQSMMVFHPPQETHAVSFHNTEVRIFRVEVKADLQRRLSDFASLPDRSAACQGGLLSSLATRLYGEFRRLDACSTLSIEGLTLEIMAEICRRNNKEVERGAPRWLEQVKEMLHESVSSPPSLETLAKATGVHPVYLAREFRKRFHCTVGEYLRQLRVEVACRQMSATTTSLADIATASGFYDQSHFSNTFKRYTGMTPAEYRMMTRFAYPSGKA